MRVPNFPLASSPDQLCPHHRHSTINMGDASSQRSQPGFRVIDNGSKAASVYHLQGLHSQGAQMFVQRRAKAESVASPAAVENV